MMSENTKEKIKIRTHLAKIIVNSSGEPYYEILYFDSADKTYHIGFGSYELSYVREWLAEEFEVDDAPPALEPERVAELAQAEKDGRLVVLPPNDPLTLEELREMDGEPVWLVGVSSSFPDGNWDICDWSNTEIALFPYCLETPDLELCGKTWLAYRRKPEEGI